MLDKTDQENITTAILMLKDEIAKQGKQLIALKDAFIETNDVLRGVLKAFHDEI